uniref:ShKT domain-containing protein n=1 Tax=Dracunculus medinensis TaxID=318479 RepID=A0A0N4USB7_DRAME
LSPPAATCRDERLNCAAIKAAHSCDDVFRATMMQQCARTCCYCT